MNCPMTSTLLLPGSIQAGRYIISRTGQHHCHWLYSRFGHPPCFYGRCQCVFVAFECSFECLRGLPVLPAADFIVGTDVTSILSFYLPFVWLGIIVDDTIVVIENTHRIYDNGKVPIVKAAKAAAGEVFIPVLAGTATTIAPFFPLLFWKAS